MEPLKKEEGEEAVQPEETVIKRFRFEKSPSNYLFLTIAVLLLWLLIEIVLIFPLPVRKSKPVSRATSFAENLMPESRSFSEYEAVFEKRQLFKASAGSGEGTFLALVGTRKMLENLTLLGVILSGQNYRALIRDKKAKSVSIYQKGDEIGGFVIDEIKPDKVLLKCNEEIIELTRRTI
jgi:hypothetical protein